MSEERPDRIIEDTFIVVGIEYPISSPDGIDYFYDTDVCNYKFALHEPSTLNPSWDCVLYDSNETFTMQDKPGVYEIGKVYRLKVMETWKSYTSHQRSLLALSQEEVEK